MKISYSGSWIIWIWIWVVWRWFWASPQKREREVERWVRTRHIVKEIMSFMKGTMLKLGRQKSHLVNAYWTILLRENIYLKRKKASDEHYSIFEKWCLYHHIQKCDWWRMMISATSLKISSISKHMKSGPNKKFSSFNLLSHQTVHLHQRFDLLRTMNS